MRAWLGAVVLVVLAVAPPARAQAMRGPAGGHDALAPAGARPLFLQGVGIDQKLDAQVPAGLVLRDEGGRDVRLGDYFGRRPLVLSLVYYDCPGLCTVVLNELQRTLRGMTPSVGEAFDVLTVSFDPRDSPALAAKKKASSVAEYGRPGAAAGWHFLTGDAEPIRRLTDAVGFRYAWDERGKQFVHAGGIIVLTPSGRVSRYFLGIDYTPADVTAALRQAAGHKIGPAAERTVLYCFRYDPTTGRYGLLIGRALRAGGVLTVAALAVVVWLAGRRGRGYAADVAAGRDFCGAGFQLAAGVEQAGSLHHKSE